MAVKILITLTPYITKCKKRKKEYFWVKDIIKMKVEVSDKVLNIEEASKRQFNIVNSDKKFTNRKSPFLNIVKIKY
jgi:hypothetical protein